MNQRIPGVTSYTYVLSGLFFLLLIPSVSSYTASGGAFYCVNCTDCVDALNNNTYYTVYLNASVSLNNTCINNPANFTGKTFDCQGNTIVYGNQSDGTYYGVYSGYDETKIRNCTIRSGSLEITDTRYGIYFSSNKDGEIEYVNADNHTHGIYLSSSSNNTLTNITVNNCTSRGVYIEEGPNNTLANLTVNSSQYGIYIESSPGNRIEDSYLSGNSQYDLYIYGDDQCSTSVENVTGSGGREIAYYNNSADLNNQEFSGLFLCGANYSSLNNVTILSPYSNNGLFISKTHHSTFTQINSSDNYEGIYLSSGSNNTFTNITTNFNPSYGIHISASPNNTLANITANSNYHGIRLGGSDNNTLTNVTANLNFEYGIFFILGSNNNTLTNVTTDSNNKTGIWFGSSYNRIQNLEMWNCSSLGGHGCVYISSPGNQIRNAYINKSSTSGITLDASGNANHNFFQDIKLENIDGYDVYLYQNAVNITLVNVTYEDEGVNSGCELTRKWYVDVNVTNSTGDPLENINVSLYNSSSFLTAYNQTQSSGLTPAFKLTEYVNTGGSKSYWTNYTLNANDTTGTYHNHTGTVNFTTNIRIDVNLTEKDNTPPQIYDVTNGSVYAIQAYILWNTSEPANSTVMFGTNQTNLTQNNSNSSLVSSHNVTARWLTRNTTYYYNVSSCDHAGNCNISGVYNFTTPGCNSSWSYGSWSSCSGGQQSRTRTDLNRCEYPWTKADTQSCGSGPSPSPPGPAPPPGNVSKNITLIPGVGLRNNTKLQEAVEKVLEQANMSEESRENMLRLSASIASDITTTRWFIMTSNKSKIQTRMKYNGSGKVRNFMVFESVPKGFSPNASYVTVIAPGAKIEVVEEDPSWIVTYPEMDTGDDVTITYEVNGTKTSSLINDVVSEVYAVSLEETEPTGEPEVPPAWVCSPGERRNYEGYLQECSEDGLEWITLETPGQFTQLTQFTDWLAGLTGLAEPMKTLVKMAVTAIVLVSVAVSIGVAVAGTAGMLFLCIPEKTRIKLDYKLYRIRYRIRYRLKELKRGSK